MKPIYHLTFGFVFAFFLYLFFPHVGILEASFIFFASFLIDIDHYFYHAFKDRDYNIKKLYLRLINKQEFFGNLPKKERENYYSGFYIFHGLETLIILFLFGFLINYLFFYIFVGFAFHILLDVLYQSKFLKRIDKVSLIRDFYKFKKLKRLK